jgi:hypothetical protein
MRRNPILWYFRNVFVGLDQLVNALLLGDPDETLSSRMGKAIAERRCLLCRVICVFLDLFESDHCRRTIEPDEGKDSLT